MNKEQMTEQTTEQVEHLTLLVLSLRLVGINTEPKDAWLIERIVDGCKGKKKSELTLERIEAMIADNEREWNALVQKQAEKLIKD